LSEVVVAVLDPQANFGPQPTIGRKDDKGKLQRFDLIPPEPLWALAELYGIGAKKYADRNWEHGIVYGRVYAALLRHLEAWRQGEDYDPDNGQHHLDSVNWNGFALRTFEARGKGAELDNLRVVRPKGIIVGA
jgi:hypothetical protein